MRKTGFLFSGQGAQYSGMMADLASEYASAREVFAVADRMLGRSISELCFRGADEELSLTHNTQPCMLAADLAAYSAMIENGVRPDAIAGFSLGEYAALVAAEVLSIEDAFRLIQIRADAMQAAVPVGCGAMAAVMKLPADIVERLCEETHGYVAIANYNCPGQIVVSGEAQAIDEFLAIAKDRKIRAVRLSVSAPFHCRLMAPAAERLAHVFAATTFRKPLLPLYMNVDGLVESDPIAIKKKMVLQAMSPVRWIDTLQNMSADGTSTFVELGPGKTLTGFVKKTIDEALSLHVENVETLNETLTALRRDVAL